MDAAKEPTVEMSEHRPSMKGEESELDVALRNFTPGSPEEKKLVRKIDLYLMPILWIMYIFNYIDRTNVVRESSTE